jgi:hypothetical protein
MRWSSLCRLAAIAALLSACHPFTKYSPQSGGACAKRAPDCKFEVIAARPTREYQTIGVIDLEAFGARYLPNDEASFRRAIAADVCGAGGDAVIAGINGDKRYIMATVVKWVEEGRTEPICPRPPPDAGVDAGKPGAKGPAEAGTDAAPAPPTHSDAAAPAAADAGAPRASLGTSARRGARGLTSEAGAPC